ncbi:hypothetical protein NDU88_004854 [Pleurodeles waltl]|uniref:Uncharacterized protein n=1 Tax=Pleurodeles waltl TaxID=8319 RepID=A0AAV7WVK3_PLEWA|nr:hypothetical protein NDU88_004854 [Pleurodeles waltl]
MIGSLGTLGACMRETPMPDCSAFVEGAVKGEKVVAKSLTESKGTVTTQSKATLSNKDFLLLRYQSSPPRIALFRGVAQPGLNGSPAGARRAHVHPAPWESGIAKSTEKFQALSPGACSMILGLRVLFCSGAGATPLGSLPPRRRSPVALRALRGFRPAPMALFDDSGTPSPLLQWYCCRATWLTSPAARESGSAKSAERFQATLEKFTNDEPLPLQFMQYIVSTGAVKRHGYATKRWWKKQRRMT